MAEMLTPLAWDTPATDKPPAPAAAGADKIGREEFLWPAPPLPSYPAAEPQSDPMPCEIVGLNDKLIAGRLTFFVPEESVAHVQVPPARTTLPLRFDQFRSMTLTTPLEPVPMLPGDPHAALLGHRASSAFRVALTGGGELVGKTVGHVESEHGLFLFPPVAGAKDDDGRVRRQFVPRAAFTSFDIGERIGEVLVAQQIATAAQVAQAIDTQKELRNQKLGDILLMRQVVSPDQLFEAIERQAKMPMVRIGEALTSLGLITESQLEEALNQQRTDRNVPLGELLVRMGVVSRTDLQVALARKMGYPLVDLDAFPIEADALRKIPYAVAQRLALAPLLIRDGRLIVALDDPARRRAAVDEAEFSAQMKVVPVLAQCRDLDDVLQAAYAKIGSSPGTWSHKDEALQPISFDLGDTDKLVETLEKDNQQARAAQDEEAPIEQSDNSLVRLINNMIVEAHKDGVSDIHIESYPGREKIRIRFRKDGLLRTYLELPASYRNAMIARIKIMCDLDISEKRKPQDGKINFAKFSPQHKIELRVATIPTNSGLEDVVMRILASAKPMPLDRLGLSDCNLTRAQARRRTTLRHGAVRRPDRLRQDDDAAFGAQPHQRARAQDLDRRGPDRDHPAGPAPGAGQPEDRLDLREGAARVPACRPGRDHGRRNPRRGDRPHRDRGLADRPPGALDTAHQQRARNRDAPAGHGHGPVQLRRLAARRAGAAPGAPPVRRVPRQPPGDRRRDRGTAGRLHARLRRGRHADGPRDRA